MLMAQDARSVAKCGVCGVECAARGGRGRAYGVVWCEGMEGLFLREDYGMRIGMMIGVMMTVLCDRGGWMVR